MAISGQLFPGLTEAYQKLLFLQLPIITRFYSYRYRRFPSRLLLRGDSLLWLLFRTQFSSISHRTWRAGRELFTDAFPALASCALCYDDLILPFLPSLGPVLPFASMDSEGIFLLCAWMPGPGLKLHIPPYLTGNL